MTDGETIDRIIDLVIRELPGSDQSKQDARRLAELDDLMDRVNRHREMAE